MWLQEDRAAVHSAGVWALMLRLLTRGTDLSPSRALGLTHPHPPMDAPNCEWWRVVVCIMHHERGREERGRTVMGEIEMNRPLQIDLE